MKFRNGFLIFRAKYSITRKNQAWNLALKANTPTTHTYRQDNQHPVQKSGIRLNFQLFLYWLTLRNDCLDPHIEFVEVCAIFQQDKTESKTVMLKHIAVT